MRNCMKPSSARLWRRSNMNQIERIQYMEQILDEATEAVKELADNRSLLERMQEVEKVMNQ